MHQNGELFPLDGSATDKLRYFVQFAVLAPSANNAQPWRFRVVGDVLQLHADRSRALPVSDPFDRDLTMSCGAALENLRVAAKRFGYRLSVDPLPLGPASDLLATVRLADRAGPTPLDRHLYDALRRRRTYRKRFGNRAIGADLAATLHEVAAARGAWLDPVMRPGARGELALLVADADRALWGNPAWRRELATWMHPRRERDGLSVPGLPAAVAQLVVRTFDFGFGIAARDRQIADGSPLLAVLGTASDTPRDWFAAGQALEAALLRACVGGLQASFLNQPTALPASRARLGQLVRRRGFPQVVLRLGYPTDELAATPRRPLDEVLDPSAQEVPPRESPELQPAAV